MVSEAVSSMRWNELGSGTTNRRQARSPITATALANVPPIVPATVSPIVPRSARTRSLTAADSVDNPIRFAPPFRSTEGELPCRFHRAWCTDQAFGPAEQIWKRQRSPLSGWVMWVRVSPVCYWTMATVRRGTPVGRSGWRPLWCATCTSRATPIFPQESSPAICAESRTTPRSRSWHN